MTTELSADQIEATLKRTVGALRGAGVDFLLAGSLASWARGGPETRHDLDFIVRPQDAERALQALADDGMRPEKPVEEWLYKAWDGEVLVDLIFGPCGLPVTDELFERAEDLHVLGMTIPALALEDLLATKLLALTEHRLDYSAVLEIARALRERIDWARLRASTEGSPFAAAFFTLVGQLGLVPEQHALHGADVRVIAPPRSIAPARSTPPSQTA